jgi:DNA-binding NarL/FixJ family response regulator
VKEATKGSVSVVLVSDHDVFAEGLGMVLCATEDIDVIGVARGAGEAIRLASSGRTDVVIVDASLPAEEVDRLRGAPGQAGLGAKLMLLGEQLPGRDGAGAIGVDALLSKHVSGRQLAKAVRALVDGQHHLLSCIAAAAREPARLMEHRRDHHDHHDRHGDREIRLGALTARERQVLAMLASGYSNRRIAAECVLSLNTVRAHVQNVLVKLGVHTRLEAAAFAVRRGFAAS